MNKITTMPQLAMALGVMYARYNAHLFGSNLPTDTVISFEPSGKHKAYGWIWSTETWLSDGKKKYGITIAQDYLDRPTAKILITLIHEMCHLHAMINGIKDTSRSGKYHNGEFKKIAEMAGLVVTKEQGIGYVTNDMTPSLLDWTLNHTVIEEIDLTYHDPEKNRPKEKNGKKSGFYKYVCPTCGKTARTTTNLFLTCGGTDNAVHAPVDMELD